MANYVVSELHGYKYGLTNLLKAIDFNIREDNLYTLGDVIDRGEEIVDTVKQFISTPNMHLLIGNHELMYVKVYQEVDLTKSIDYQMYVDEMTGKDKCLCENEMIKFWFENGGYKTYEQMKAYSDIYNVNLFKEFYEYLLDCEVVTCIDNNILVHAGVPVNIADALDIKDPVSYLVNNFDVEDLVENRELWTNAFVYSTVTSIPKYRTIIGHTPVIQNPNYKDEITKDLVVVDNTVMKSSLVCIDLASYWTKQLGVLNLDTGEFTISNNKEIKRIQIF